MAVFLSALIAKWPYPLNWSGGPGIAGDDQSQGNEVDRGWRQRLAAMGARRGASNGAAYAGGQLIRGAVFVAVNLAAASHSVFKGRKNSLQQFVCRD